MAERCSKKSKLSSSREKELHAEIEELQAELNAKRFEVAKYNKEFSEIEVRFVTFLLEIFKFKTIINFHFK